MCLCLWPRRLLQRVRAKRVKGRECRRGNYSKTEKRREREKGKREGGNTIIPEFPRSKINFQPHNRGNLDQTLKKKKRKKKDPRNFSIFLSFFILWCTVLLFISSIFLLLPFRILHLHGRSLKSFPSPRYKITGKTKYALLWLCGIQDNRERNLNHFFVCFLFLSSSRPYLNLRNPGRRRVWRRRRRRRRRVSVGISEVTVKGSFDIVYMWVKSGLPVYCSTLKATPQARLRRG